MDAFRPSVNYFFAVNTMCRAIYKQFTKLYDLSPSNEIVDLYSQFTYSATYIMYILCFYG